MTVSKETPRADGRWARADAWLDERVGHRNLIRELLDTPMVGGARWAYVFGSALAARLRAGARHGAPSHDRVRAEHDHRLGQRPLHLEPPRRRLGHPRAAPLRFAGDGRPARRAPPPGRDLRRVQAPARDELVPRARAPRGDARLSPSRDTCSRGTRRGTGRGEWRRTSPGRCRGSARGRGSSSKGGPSTGASR